MTSAVITHSCCALPGEITRALLYRQKRRYPYSAGVLNCFYFNPVCNHTNLLTDRAPAKYESMNYLPGDILFLLLLLLFKNLKFDTSLGIPFPPFIGHVIPTPPCS